MFEHISGTGAPVSCGRFMLTARACCEWSDLDCDYPAIGADDIRVSVHNAAGDFLAEFCFIRAAYDADGFDFDDEYAELLDENGTPQDDAELFGRSLPRVRAAIRAALASLQSVIEPACVEFLKDVENEF